MVFARHRTAGQGQGKSSGVMALWRTLVGDNTTWAQQDSSVRNDTPFVPPSLACRLSRCDTSLWREAPEEFAHERVGKGPLFS